MVIHIKVNDYPLLLSLYRNQPVRYNYIGIRKGQGGYKSLDKVDDRVKDIAFKLRKIRELKGLTREKFCEALGENSEYWGLIERGEQAISLTKLLQVCEAYHIPIEEVVSLDYETIEDSRLRREIDVLVTNCKGRQLEVIKKFIEDIAMTI